MTPSSPHDLDAVRQHLMGLADKQEAIEAALALLDDMRAQSDALVRKNQSLELKLQQLLRKEVGRRTEKVSPDQLQLVLAHAEDDGIIDEPPPEPIAEGDAIVTEGVQSVREGAAVRVANAPAGQENASGDGAPQSGRRQGS